MNGVRQTVFVYLIACDPGIECRGLGMFVKIFFESGFRFLIVNTPYAPADHLGRHTTKYAIFTDIRIILG